MWMSRHHFHLAHQGGLRRLKLGGRVLIGGNAVRGAGAEEARLSKVGGGGGLAGCPRTLDLTLQLGELE